MRGFPIDETFVKPVAFICSMAPRLKRASQLVAITKYGVRLIAKKALLVADLRIPECDGFVLGHIGNRDQNCARTVTKTVTNMNQKCSDEAHYSCFCRRGRLRALHPIRSSSFFVTV